MNWIGKSNQLGRGVPGWREIQATGSFFIPLWLSLSACLIAAIVRETMVALFQEQENRRNYPERVYSVAQASEITGYSKNSLYQMHSQGKVPGAHKVGSKLMFDTAATLREWVEKGGGK